MALLEEVLPALREGKRVRRRGWHGGAFLDKVGDTDVLKQIDAETRWDMMTTCDILATDWEVAPEVEEVEVWDWVVHCRVTGSIWLYVGHTVETAHKCVPNIYRELIGRIEESKRTIKRPKA